MGRRAKVLAKNILSEWSDGDNGATHDVSTQFLIKRLSAEFAGHLRARAESRVQVISVILEHWCCGIYGNCSLQIHNSNNCNSSPCEICLGLPQGLTTVPALADVVGVGAEVHATSEYGTTYRVYIRFDAPDDELIAVYGTVGEVQNALSILTTSSFFNSELGSNFGEDINPAFFAVFPEIEYDSWLTIGTEDTNGPGGVSAVGMEPYLRALTPVMDSPLIRLLGRLVHHPRDQCRRCGGRRQQGAGCQLTTDGVVTVVLNT